MATAAVSIQRTGILDKRALLQQVWQRPVRDVMAVDSPHSAALLGVLFERRTEWPSADWAAAVDELHASRLTVGQFLEREGTR